VPGALFDFGLFFFHNVYAQLERGAGPWFYLPKLESHHEARLWNEVFAFAEGAMGVPRRSIRATVLIETLPAAFEMDEILYALRDHSAGLGCGRWDYIFSCIKTRGYDPAAVLPDRSQVTMTQPALRACTQLLIRTCHRRGAPAMGGVAAQIPIRDDPAASAAALQKVCEDKLREVSDGHDGTWVAHPGLVPAVRAVFDRHMTGPNQLGRLREDVVVSAADLLQVPEGTRTEEGFRHNVRVGIQYLEAWLRGDGCVPLYHLMEDAATAEISRAQVWQWLHHGARLDDGRPVTVELLRWVVAQEMERIGREVGLDRIVNGRFIEARNLFTRLCLKQECAEFLTLDAYELL
jgi:malate synthase